MQLILNFRNVVVGTTLVVAGYYGYRGLVADIQTDDVARLFRSHRDAQPARQVIIKRHLLAVYQRRRDFRRVVHALDYPSPVSQALAVEVLASKCEREAVPRLLKMLHDARRDDLVKQELAGAMAVFKSPDAVPRLIELTDATEAPAVRSAAHDALRSLTGAGASVKFGDATRQHWTLWWRDHRTVVR